jgi:hypothetical protein
VHHAISIGAALVAFTTLAAPAHGATIAVEGTTLAVHAAPGEDNLMLVERTGPMVFRVTDDGAPVTAGAGCGTFDPRTVVCVGIVTAARADMGDGKDTFSAVGLPLPVTADGGDGADLLEGGLLADGLDGGAGADGIGGGAGDDTVTGGSGDDALDGDGGADTVKGGDGADIADGGASSGDAVDGGAGADLLQGGPGEDTVDGGAGDDVLSPGGGDDALTTGTGADRVYLPADGDSTVNCRAGDEVRGPADAVPDRCTQLSASAPKPVSWARSRQPARGAYFPVRVSVRPIVRRRARVARVFIKTGRPSRRYRVRLRFYSRTGHALKPITRRVRTERLQGVRLPRRDRAANRGSGKVLR